MRLFNAKRIIGKLTLTAVVALSAMGIYSCSDVWNEQHPGTYYVNSGNTLATFLEDHPTGQFSDFVYILKKAGIWGEMKSYGEHTCFAPTNEAVQEYLQERYDEAIAAGKPEIANQFVCLDSLPLIVIDSIAKTHLCTATFYCSDMSGDGAFPTPNMLDRYLTYMSYAETIWSAAGDTFKLKLAFRVNQQSKIIEDDDSVQNGVVQIIDKVLRPSNKFLPGLLKENPKAQRFYEALISTGLKDSLEAFQDDSYPGVSYDSTLVGFQQSNKGVKYKTSVENETGVFPEKRQFKFTMFVIPDSVLETLGVTDLTSFRAYAETQYPEGAGLPDESRESSLNKFLSYHILPVYLTWDQLNTSQPELIVRRKYLDELDVEDFYETMLPHSIMRISTPYKKESYSNAAQITESEKYGIFINRKGTLKDEDNLIPGIQIQQVVKSDDKTSDITSDALNGCYYYINEPLIYNAETRKALKVRMRIMSATLSPDFINSGARGRLRVSEKDRYTVGFLPGFCKNVECTPETEYWVRYRDAGFGTIYGDEMTIKNVYDITFRLPSVPNNGTYEIRIWNNSMSSNPSACDRGVAQFYFRGKGAEWEPCGIPVDLRLNNKSPLIGWVKFGNLKDEDEIQMNEKAMRNLGYMRAPDIYADLHKDDENCHRKIITTQYMRADGDYYLRLRQILEAGVIPFSFIEIVPKDIYAGDEPEDRH